MSSGHDNDNCDPRHRICLRARWRGPRLCPRSAQRELLTAEQLMAQTLAGDPSKEVNAQVYTFPPGAVLRWHIHPDAYEIAYVLEGTFSFEREGRRQK